MTHLEELSDIVNRLKDLLDDPHPGVMTWREALARTSKEFLAFYDADASPVNAAEKQEIWDMATEQAIGDMERALLARGIHIAFNLRG